MLIGEVGHWLQSGQRLAFRRLPDVLQIDGWPKLLQEKKFVANARCQADAEHKLKRRVSDKTPMLFRLSYYLN